MQLGFFFDQFRCSGCEACMLACRQWHGEDDNAVDLLSVSEMEFGRFPLPTVKWMVVPCLQCAEPACQAACPTGAISKNPENGIVAVDREKCLGKDACGECQTACPYDVPRFRDEADAKMVKCDFCEDRLKEGKKPLCVIACPMRALDIGPLDELLSKAGYVQEADGFAYDRAVRPSVVLRPK